MVFCIFQKYTYYTIMNKKLLIALFVLLNASASLKGQSVACDSLYSPCTNTISTNGFYFDLEPTGSNLLIEHISTMSQNPGARDLEIYWKTGSHVGFETDPGAWTLIGTTSGFDPDTTISCPMDVTPIPLQLNTCIPDGQISSFYVMKVNGTGSFEANADVSAGTIVADDGTLILYAGQIASGYSTFSSVGMHNDHSFQGAIKYSCGCTPLSVTDNKSQNLFSLYPSPASNNINIDLKKIITEPVILRMIDMTGRVILTSDFNGNNLSNSIDISAFSNGLYSVQLISGTNGSVIGKKLFVKN